MTRVKRKVHTHRVRNNSFGQNKERDRDREREKKKYRERERDGEKKIQSKNLEPNKCTERE